MRAHIGAGSTVCQSNLQTRRSLHYVHCVQTEEPDMWKVYVRTTYYLFIQRNMKKRRSIIDFAFKPCLIIFQNKWKKFLMFWQSTVSNTAVSYISIWNPGLNQIIFSVKCGKDIIILVCMKVKVKIWKNVILKKRDFPGVL